MARALEVEGLIASGALALPEAYREGFALKAAYLEAIAG